MFCCKFIWKFIRLWQQLKHINLQELFILRDISYTYKCTSVKIENDNTHIIRRLSTDVNDGTYFKRIPYYYFVQRSDWNIVGVNATVTPLTWVVARITLFQRGATRPPQDVKAVRLYGEFCLSGRRARRLLWTVQDLHALLHALRRLNGWDILVWKEKSLLMESVVGVLLLQLENVLNRERRRSHRTRKHHWQQPERLLEKNIAWIYSRF